MKRQVDIVFKDTQDRNIEKVKTVDFDESLLTVFDELKKRKAIIIGIDANWQ
jgi:hypothetical protein